MNSLNKSYLCIFVEFLYVLQYSVYRLCLGGASAGKPIADFNLLPNTEKPCIVNIFFLFQCFILPKLVIIKNPMKSQGQYPVSILQHSFCLPWTFHHKTSVSQGNLYRAKLNLQSVFVINIVLGCRFFWSGNKLIFFYETNLYNLIFYLRK
jgi:hypothetical protein